MLYILLIAACLIPVVPGIIFAKKNGFSPHWYWISVIPFAGFMVMMIMYVDAPVDDKSKTQEEIKTEKEKRRRKALTFIMTIVLMFGMLLFIDVHFSVKTSVDGNANYGECSVADSQD